MMMKNLILASGSPRRKELLSLYTMDFTICVSDFDESGVTAPTPAQLVEKLARGKCLAVLRALSGATHEVHTGVCVSDGVRTESFVDSCRVTFFPISEGEIDAYTATKEPYDKAGAYAIQGRAALWLDRLEGDYYTIMGLPVSRTARLLSRF